MYQDVFVLGARGRVGKTLVRQIYERGDCDTTLHRNPTRIVGLGEFDCFHFDPRGISRNSAEDFCNKRAGYQRMDGLNSLLDFVLKNYPSPNGERMLVFADVTNAREEMGKFHIRVMGETPFGLVTSNKHPLVLCSFDEFQVLTREPARYGYRCAVMAGAEAVDKVRDLRDLGDLPIEISGCFSGTLGYGSTEIESKPLSKTIRRARELGYTEPNPADDLDGGDVERKIVTLARTAGFDVPKSRILRTPFIPEEYLAEKDIDKFLDNLKNLDEQFAERVARARDSNNVLRYVARFDNSGELPAITVGLIEVPRDSALGCLRGTANKVVIRTKTYNEIPYCVEAPGAGLEITAQNVRRDLLDQLKNRITSFSRKWEFN